MKVFTSGAAFNNHTSNSTPYDLFSLGSGSVLKCAGTGLRVCAAERGVGLGSCTTHMGVARCVRKLAAHEKIRPRLSALRGVSGDFKPNLRGEKVQEGCFCLVHPLSVDKRFPSCSLVALRDLHEKKQEPGVEKW